MKIDKVSIIMGSQSDWKTLQLAENILNEFNIPNEVKIISAHRTPDRLYKYAKNVNKNNIKVIIAGAGGAAASEGGLRRCRLKRAKALSTLRNQRTLLLCSDGRPQQMVTDQAHQGRGGCQTRRRVHPTWAGDHGGGAGWGGSGRKFPATHGDQQSQDGRGAGIQHRAGDRQGLGAGC